MNAQAKTRQRHQKAIFCDWCNVLFPFFIQIHRDEQQKCRNRAHRGNKQAGIIGGKLHDDGREAKGTQAQNQQGNDFKFGVILIQSSQLTDSVH